MKCIKFFRFRVLLSMLLLKPEHAILVTYACVVLHNLLIDRRQPQYLTHVARQHRPNAVHTNWREAASLLNLQQRRGNSGTEAGKAVRDYMKDYVNGDMGRVEWQDDAVRANVSNFSVW